LEIYDKISIAPERNGLPDKEVKAIAKSACNYLAGTRREDIEKLNELPPLDQFAQLRGWSPEAMRAIGAQGHYEINFNGIPSKNIITFQSYDSERNPVGRRIRKANNAPFSKGKALSEKGQPLGLFFPPDFPTLGPVHVTEGEADACAAINAGLSAVIGTGGTNLGAIARPSLQNLCANRDVVLWPQSDDASKKWMHETAALLTAAEAKVFFVPADPKVKDLDDRLKRESDKPAAIERWLKNKLDWKEPAPEDWPEPNTPKREAVKLPPFPIEVYSQAPQIKAYIEQLSASKSTPVDFAAVGVLPIISACLMGKVTISPQGGYREPAMLYVAIGGDPASGKSQIFRELMPAIKEVEKEKVSILRDKYAKTKADRSVIQQQIKAIENSARKGEIDPQAQEELRRLNVRLEALPELYATSMIIEDATSERAAVIASSRDGCLMFASDEGTPFRMAKSQRNDSAIISLNQLFKKGHSGDSFTQSRMGRADIDIPQLFMSALSMTQPDEFVDLLQDRSLIGEGSLSRFLYSVPEVKESKPLDWLTNSSEEVEKHNKDSYYRLVSDLSEVEPCTVLRLSDSAKQVAPQYISKVVNPLMAKSSKHQDAFLKSFFAKTVKGGTVLRLALALHAIQHGKHLGAYEVSGQTMTNACKLYDYFIAHAQALRINSGQCDTLELQVYEWIKENGFASFSKSTFQSKWKRQLPKSRDRDEFCQGLEESGIIMESKVKSANGPAKTVFQVNPRIFS
jgi:hypothetical protein